MNHWTTPFRCVAGSALAIATVAAGLVGPAQAAVPGITGVANAASAPAGRTFNLSASAALISQPDGAMIYSWGYGCTPVSATVAAPGFAPAQLAAQAFCPKMQLPAPTLIVTEGDVVTINLTNSLPGVAGNTSILFPGQTVTATGGTPGALAKEAAASDCTSAPGCNTVSYSFTAAKPGTYTYHSGSRPELQVEMGMYGAIVVLPASPPVACTKGAYALAASAYDHAATCYDREFLFQFSEISSVIHDDVKAQVDACSASSCPLVVTTDPYRPNYYLVNGRSMPDLMDGPYSAAYPKQPYNGNPHMHPGETMLMRNVGHGRWQHPFHFHGNHARVIARDGNMLLSATDASKLAGPLLFTLPTLPGQTVDMLFSWTGQGLNWDIYGEQIDPVTNAKHSCNGVAFDAAAAAQRDPTNAANLATLAALKTNGGFDSVSKEYCPDHGKPIPVTPPDPSIVANGQWYGGTPYLGLSGFDPTKLAPGTLNQNPGAGYAYMWHSHNEREITTNDVFPGGMMMMLIVDPTAWTIDETQ